MEVFLKLFDETSNKTTYYIRLSVIMREILKHGQKNIGIAKDNKLWL